MLDRNDQQPVKRARWQSFTCLLFHPKPLTGSFGVQYQHSRGLEEAGFPKRSFRIIQTLTVAPVRRTSKSGSTMALAPSDLTNGMRYELTDLKIFLAIADEGNVSRGAERCHLAPSSASLRIKNLEASVGVTLFKRQA
ncbi:MAG: LysR family transcriptional regulator, partial [Paraburkholderia sp.]|uniref:helix-turn-helix domain-containing protein n=1 Tax=Paraburkholderia sp. TaxID=1926495 RepID=UPI00397CC09F